MNLQKYTTEQIETARKVMISDDFKKTELIAGADQEAVGRKIISAIAVLDQNMNIVEEQTAVVETRFPYLPGYLYFREGPSVREAFGKLKTKPDILLIKGHGILHPLRCGFASHVGVALGIPTIGVAKSLLAGRIEEEGKVIFNNEVRGYEVKTKEHGKPLFISPGHKISIESSVQIVKKSIRPPHKMPEQLHAAHKVAMKMKDELESNTQ